MDPGEDGGSHCSWSPAALFQRSSLHSCVGGHSAWNPGSFPQQETKPSPCSTDTNFQSCPWESGGGGLLVNMPRSPFEIGVSECLHPTREDQSQRGLSRPGKLPSPSERWSIPWSSLGCSGTDREPLFCCSAGARPRPADHAAASFSSLKPAPEIQLYCSTFCFIFLLFPIPC